jgi:hypothetical protein
VFSLSLSLSLLHLDNSEYLYLLCASPLECLCKKNKDRCKADNTLRVLLGLQPVSAFLAETLEEIRTEKIDRYNRDIER